MLSSPFFEKTITEMPAYKRLEQDFRNKGYTLGEIKRSRFNSDLPLKSLPRDEIKTYLINNLSGCHKDYIEYVKAHPAEFGRQFFKDCIASHYYALEFEQNIFEWMDPSFIDEELVMCAIIRAVNMRYVDRRNECDAWFYSVHKRKPELLTYDMYVLGARCFASRSYDGNKFLAITPEKYRTVEYYVALCMMNNSTVTEDIPAEVLTDEFLLDLLVADFNNIKCFTEEALERELPVGGERMKMKSWQLAVFIDGYRIRDIPLNDERVEYFLHLYDKDSSEYEYGFKRHYKAYLRKKNETKSPADTSSRLAATATLFGALLGMSVDEAVDLGNDVVKSTTDRRTGLPIEYGPRVPKEFAKLYDREEYLLELYKKLGIQILGERDGYFYDAILPEGAVVVADDAYCTYRLEIDGKTVIKYKDIGPFYDRTVCVTEVDCTL